MLLDKKSYDLLVYLLVLEQHQTISHIAEKLEQSRRKIYYHLEKINDSLPNDVEPITSIPRLGILLSPEQKAACQKLLHQTDSYFYVMSADERLILTTLAIATSNSRMTIDRLISICQVSRNTVLSDLNQLRNRLSEAGLGIKLSVTKAKGYHFEGHPMAFIQYCYGVLLSLDQMVSNRFAEIVFEQLRNINQPHLLASDALHTYIGQFFVEAELKLGKSLNQKERHFFVNSLPYLLLAYRKLECPATFRDLLSQELAPVRKRLEFRLVEEMNLAVQERFDLALEALEIDIITLLLLSFRKDKDSHLESSDYASLRQSLVTYLNYFQEHFGSQFINREDLEKQLLMHCKSLLYRKQYGIPSYNPLTETIKEKYERLYTMVASTIYLLEGGWQVSLNDDEIAFLVIHIGGAIRRHKDNYHQKKTVIVSDDGIAIQKFLLSRTQRFIPSLKIEAVFTTEQFQSVADLLQINFIITTQDSLETDLPVVFVNPLMTNDDIVKLLRVTQGNTQPWDAQGIQEKIKVCIEQFAPGCKHTDQLTKSIEEVIYQDFISDFISYGRY
ncbi:L-ascorbate 6-phosphate lactonase [Streptococcus agalactiae LMG 14747]|uniref:L-ascorbate 6-phosphate lactonase n=1 Tax=Streptococcus agalactiae LMG 14747 TaxID=1154860 RepID=V6Z3G5_STRAG|nr:L-ascorbate 6-phosphate lactonase [Streptococcus agalactiae LMG 14747]